MNQMTYILGFDTGTRDEQASMISEEGPRVLLRSDSFFGHHVYTRSDHIDTPAPCARTSSTNCSDSFSTSSRPVGSA